MLALEETLRIQPTAFCISGNRFYVSKYRCFGRTAWWFLFSHFNFMWMNVSAPLWRADFSGEDEEGRRTMEGKGKAKGYKGTKDNTSSAVPQVLPLAVLLPLQWLHPVQTQTIMSSVFISAGVAWGNADGWAPPIHQHSPMFPLRKWTQSVWLVWSLISQTEWHTSWAWGQ